MRVIVSQADIPYQQERFPYPVKSPLFLLEAKAFNILPYYINAEGGLSMDMFIDLGVKLIISFFGLWIITF
ncbi:hypothetical protein P0100_24810, partial [Yersinia pestis]|nr:hypothetical protein [Yersinia pestis]